MLVHARRKIQTFKTQTAVEVTPGERLEGDAHVFFFIIYSYNFCIFLAMSMYNEKLLNITNHSGSANQSHDTTVTLTRMALIKQTNKQKTPEKSRRWRGWGDVRTLGTGGGNVENSMGPPQKIKRGLVTGSANFTSVLKSRESRPSRR